MKKVVLVVQDCYAEDALKELRNVGTVHIEMSKAPSEKINQLLKKKARAEDAISLIKPYKVAEKNTEVSKRQCREIGKKSCK
jgi:vacuolar-type H+-ATPase subunit I/STV1